MNSDRETLELNNLTIGEQSYGLPSMIGGNEAAHCYIGKYCSISDRVVIFLGADHNADWCSTFPFGPQWQMDVKGHPKTKGDVVIGNDVWLGWNCTIMSGVHIGDGAVVGACSVVTKDVPSYAIVAGNPARVKKFRFYPIEIVALHEMKWWDWPVEKVREAVPLLSSKKVTELYEWWKKNLNTREGL